MPGREKPCVHTGELWRWRRDQGKRQERATRSPGRSWRRYALDLCRMICLNPVRHAVRKTVSSTRVLPAWQGSWGNRDTQQRQAPTKDA